MTLKEIAEKAGVSISTVSRVINHGGKNVASKETQNKIWEVIRESGYLPNQHARNLKLGNKLSEASSKQIACVFARVADECDPFFTIILRAIEREAFSRGYTIRYSFSVIDFDSPQTYRLISENTVNSIAVLGRFDSNVYSMLKANFKHIIYTGLNVLPFKVDQIISSGYGAATMAVNHLLELGHRKICYIGEKEDEQRYLGYVDAMQKAGISDIDRYTIDAPLSPTGGYNATKRLIESGIDFTALFCANDFTAMGAMKALKEHKLKIPEDVSVIGIDDLETVQYISPMLTTIHIPIEELGKMTAKTLIDRIEGGHHMNLKIELPYYIVHRETCAKCKS